MKNQKLVSLRPIIVITASAILSVLFILILYYADNKYTVGGKQPELGRLELRSSSNHNLNIDLI